ncbi:gonadotropin-releasing hormone receptor [Caerostris extrusa]|uniref:Gonadotropin-releasing hormone receptor n=1 Tax=Caerostris extrusa TaxID=172846 RepID=A0AAV4NXI9_CAEEX|nr:gonadotropin-releasing hormone receptor [Caerostris extrusa]
MYPKQKQVVPEENGNSFFPDVALAPRSLRCAPVALIVVREVSSTTRAPHSHSSTAVDASIQEETIAGPNFSLIGGNCTLNSTDPCDEPLHAPQFENSTLIKGLILSSIAVFSFVGNVSTLVSIIKIGRLGSSTVYMLLSQLAIADLLVTLFCILAEGLWTLSVEWYGGNLLCKMVKFMQMFALYLSTFVLVLIGFDRLCAVRFPMHRAHAKTHVRRGIACIWILSGIFSTPQVCGH